MSRYDSDEDAARGRAEILKMAQADIDSGRAEEGAPYDVEVWIVPMYLDAPADIPAARAALDAAGIPNFEPEDPPDDENYVLVATLPRVENTAATVLEALESLDALLAPAEAAGKGWTLRPPAPRDAAELRAAWDFECQKARTAATYAMILRKSPLKAEDPVPLDVQLDPGLPGADFDAVIAALEAGGLRVSRIEGEPEDWVEATAPDTPFTFEAIWEVERRVAEIALSHGFRPDGWGVMIPPRQGIAGALERLKNKLLIALGVIRPAHPD